MVDDPMRQWRLTTAVVALGTMAAWAGWQYASGSRSASSAPSAATEQSVAAPNDATGETLRLQHSDNNGPGRASTPEFNDDYSAEDEEMIAGVGGRQAAYDQLLEQPPMAVWQHWQMLFEQNDVSELALANHALGRRLQQVGDETVYQAIRERLQQADLPNERKAWLVALLTEVATPAALDILLDAALNPSDAELRNTVLDGIRQMGDRRWDGRFHPELSALLEDAWSQADHADAELLTALALTMAKAGAANGVEQLVAAIANSGKSMQEIQHGQDARAHAALNALMEVRNPEAIPTLVKWFNSAYSSDDTAFIASGDALAAMGLPEATKILLEWAKHTADNAAPLAGRWLGEVRDTESVQLLRDVVSRSEPFQSGVVKEKLAGALVRVEPTLQ